MINIEMRDLAQLRNQKEAKIKHLCLLCKDVLSDNDAAANYAICSSCQDRINYYPKNHQERRQMVIKIIIDL